VVAAVTMYSSKFCFLIAGDITGQFRSLDFRIPLRKFLAKDAQPVTKFRALYGTRMFVTVFTRARHWSLSWARWIHVRFQVLAAASVKFGVFWDVAPCSLVGVDRRFRGVYCLHHQADDSVVRTASIRAMNHLPDDAGSTYLWNVGLLGDYTALNPRRLQTSDEFSRIVTYFCKIHFNIILSARLTSPKWSLYFRIFYLNLKKSLAGYHNNVSVFVLMFPRQFCL
jgi:hypothetical protein